MNFKRIARWKLARVINDLAERGARIKIIIYDYPYFFIEARWRSGRLWHIKAIT